MMPLAGREILRRGRSRLKSVMPIARQRSSCSGLLTTSRAKISPFRQRMAAAVSTPSGAPPVPITACTPRADDGGRDAGRQIAVADQADAGAGRADVGDELLVARPIEHDDDQILDVAAETLRRSRSGCRRTGASRCDRVLRARPDDELLHVEVGRVQQAAACSTPPARRWRSARRSRTGWCLRADRPRCRPRRHAPRRRSARSI